MKKLWKIYDLSLIYILSAIFLSGVIVSYNFVLAIIQFSLTLIYAIGKFAYHKNKREKLLHKIQTVSEELQFDKGIAFQKLTVACVAIESDGSIIWFNNKFSETFSIDKTVKKTNITEFTGEDDLQFLKAGLGYNLRVGNQYFSVYSNDIMADDEQVFLLYFYNETEYRNLEKHFNETRPSVMVTVIDNAGEIYQNFKESECASIFSLAESMIEQWAAGFGCLCRKYSNVRMMIIAEEKNLQRMIDDKFTILDKIRDLVYDSKDTDITLSIGIGRENSLLESQSSAKDALEMAEGRGGDQVVIKTGTQYDFYGGVSEGFERKNKVRTRLIASTVAKLISESDNVLIMGHRFSDFDSFGSAVGVYNIASHFGKKAKIVINTSTTLARPLVKLFCEKVGKDALVDPQKALDYVTDDTLVVVVDTHKKDFCECPELIDTSSIIVVIDHHRKSADFINNTAIFYHIPNASSACEMVTELAQYINSKDVIDKFAATALLSGIMLDTRNFILRAGVRTFEAAAFLRSKGAGTVECKRLFSSDMEIFRNRNAIIDSAEKYRDCAVSFTDEMFSNLRLATSQAADEMLNIEGVKASFVIFKSSNAVNISARSYGEINVQLIMEALGGGGHQTMAACQLKDITIQEAKSSLKDAIDNYYSNINGG